MPSTKSTQNFLMVPLRRKKAARALDKNIFKQYLLNNQIQNNCTEMFLVMPSSIISRLVLLSCQSSRSLNSTP